MIDIISSIVNLVTSGLKDHEYMQFQEFNFINGQYVTDLR